MESFLRGGAIGFAIAAPVGPIGLLCIRRTLAGGVLAGLTTGLGAACADAVYAALAALALAGITRVLVAVSGPLHVGGAFALVALGGHGVWRATQRAPSIPASPARGFTTTFLLTLANPTTIFSFAAVVSAAGFGTAPSRSCAPVIVAGVFAGSAAWWALLSSVVGVLRRGLSSRAVRAVDAASGLLLAAFGAALLLHP